MYYAIEGIDGVGKTTLAKRLAEKLNGKYVSEPNQKDTLCKKLREIALDKRYETHLPDTARELIINASRIISNGTLLDLISQGHVVADRSFVSGIVYSPYKVHDWLSKFNDIAIYPDVLILILANRQNLKYDSNEFYDNQNSEFFDEKLQKFRVVVKTLGRLCPRMKIITFHINLDKPKEENFKSLCDVLIDVGVMNEK